MPIVVALAIRSLIQMAVTLGIISLAEKYVLPLINRAIEEIIKVLGVNEEDAKDILSNEILQFAEQVGIGTLTLRAKIPTKISERLGFTSKGFAKRTLSTKAAGAVGRAVPITTGAAGSLTALTTAEAATVAAKAKAVIPGFRVAHDILIKTLGVGFLGAMAIAQWIDFGNWNSGAYQKKMQALLSFLTFGLLTPDKDYRQSLTLSSDVFGKVFNTYKLEGATAISDPFKAMSVPFTRENLLDLTDKIGAELLRATGKASTKEVLAATQQMLIFSPESFEKAAAARAAGVATTPTIKVFTGIVAQGTIGAAEPFFAREDDLIDSVEDLKAAAENNLVPFLTALPGRILYELKIVSSVITKDGTKRTGSTQQIQVGQFADGRPRFKVVKNKFAVIDVYVWTARNVRSKIDTIVLGPVDSAKLQPAGATLNDLSAQFRESLTTSNIGEISAIETSQQLTILPPKTAPPLPPLPAAAAPAPAMIITPTIASISGHFLIWGRDTGGNSTVGPFASREEAEQYARDNPDNLPNLKYWTFTDIAQAPNPSPPRAYTKQAPPAPTPSSTVPPNNNPNKCQASTIAEFFDVNRINYPSVVERGKLYELYGLGAAAWYTGTSEQNTKLLTEFKRRSNC